MSFRVSKRRDKKPAFLRSSSSSTKTTQIRKPALKKSVTLAHDDDGDDHDERLEDLGSVASLGATLNLQDVQQTMMYVTNNTFDDLPTERSGMNGARVAEVLNFRKNLPPIVTNAHVHALLDSPTQVEKEIGQLVSIGVIKRIVVPGRGVGASSISDALVLVADWKDKIDASSLSNGLKDKYVQLLSTGQDVKGSLSAEESTTLIHAGFLTSASAYGTTTNTSTLDIKDLSRTAISVHNIARAASGSIDAVGGQGAIYRIGGGGTSGLSAANRSDERTGNLKLSLPNVGVYLKLLQGAQEHLVSLLSKSKYNEAPVYLIKERWDGGISTKNPYGRSKDPFKMILPGKTRKWKDFMGLKFDWVLAECIGSGLIELFNTRSVGLGMRLT